MILGGGKLKLGGGNPPFPRVLYETLSRYVIAHDQFYKAFPGLVLQTTNARLSGPGYEASRKVHV